jgi:PAS domain S-box-containing protein
MTPDLAPLLVVDDDEANRDMLARRLTRSGFRVATAASGAEALAHIEANATELVLLDGEMPGMTGLQVLREIRKTRSSSVLPVVMVTARNESADIVEALNLGADDYITKPIDYAVALARIRTQLSRKQAEGRLRESEERYALAAMGANDGLWDWDLASGKIYLSPRWKSIVGAEPEAIGEDPKEWFDRIHPDDLDRVRQHLAAHLKGRSPHFECEHRIRHESGAFRWVLVRGLAIRDVKGAAIRIAGSQADLTSTKVLDPLTGLPNHRLLNDRLERALSLQKLQEDKRCAVLLFDLDGLKLINDSLGHHAGDELIQAVAGRLDASLRATDTIVRADTGDETSGPRSAPEHTLARLGGDEFIILLPDAQEIADVTCVADRLQQLMAQPFDVAGHQIFATASIGIALSRPGRNNPKELLRDADTAMHRAKHSGTGRYEIFDETMRQAVQQRLLLETDLRHAVTREEFVPYFQPIVELTTGRLAGFEALLRWRHPTRGVVLPAEFVPVVEENGLIVPIGRWCFEEVCRQMREWLDTYACPEHFWVSVNFSRQQFLEDGLVPWLLGCLERSNLLPSHIVVEITESTAVQDLDRTMHVLGQLREAGVKALMDDFGTGHSSLVCLHQLPIGGLKLDRTLLLATEKHPALLETVVGLAGSLGLTVTAEGIETESQCERVAAVGCDFAQGYIFERPVEAGKAGEIITANERWLQDLVTPAAFAGRSAHNVLQTAS